MLDTIFGWFVSGIFGLMGDIYTGMTGFINFTNRDIGYLIPGISDYLPGVGSIKYDSVIYAFAYGIVLFNICLVAIKGITSPMTGANAAGPLKMMIRVGIAFSLILLSGDIQNWFFQAIDFVTQAIGSISTDAWQEELGDLVTQGFGDNVWIALIFGIILLFQLVPALIAYVERYILFGINMIISPLAFAFYTSEEGADIPKQWLQSTIQHFFCFMFSYLAISLFIKQIPLFGDGASAYQGFVMSSILLTLAKNSEKLFTAFGIRSMSTGDLARGMISGAATAYGMGRFAMGKAKAGWGHAKSIAGKASRLPGQLRELGMGKRMKSLMDGSFLKLGQRKGAANPLHSNNGNKFEESGRNAAKENYTPQADENGMIKDVKEKPLRSDVKNAVDNTKGYSDTSVVNHAQKEDVRNGYRQQQSDISEAASYVREAQQGIAIGADENGNLTNVFYADDNGEMVKFNGTAKDLSDTIGTGNTSSVMYGEIDQSRLQTDKSGNVTGAYVQGMDGNFTEFHGTAAELDAGLKNGTYLDASYTDKNGNERMYSQDDMHYYTPYVTGSEFNTAFNLDKHMPDGSAVAEDSRARFGGFETREINGQQRLVPTFGAAVQHVNGRGDEVTVVSAQSNLSDSSISGIPVINTSGYKDIGGGFKAYRAPVQAFENNSKTPNASYGEFIHSMDSKHYDSLGNKRGSSPEASNYRGNSNSRKNSSGNNNNKKNSGNSKNKPGGKGKNK